MTAMFDEAAGIVAQRVKLTRLGFTSMRREDFRAAFQVGRLTEGQSAGICDALARRGIIVFPHPFDGSPMLRLYDQSHPLGSVAEAVIRPDAMPETALRRAAEVFERESAGRDLRSDDAPWLAVFDLFLQTALAREPTAWEDLRDDRHPVELARDLALALGIAADCASRASTLQLAAAVGAFRPRASLPLARQVTGSAEDPATAAPLLDALGGANRRLEAEYDRILKEAASLLLGRPDVPTTVVELGRLGLRYRRELVQKEGAE